MRSVDRHPLFGVRKRFGRSTLLPLDEATSDLDTASERSNEHFLVVLGAHSESTWSLRFQRTLEALDLFAPSAAHLEQCQRAAGGR